MNRMNNPAQPSRLKMEELRDTSTLQLYLLSLYFNVNLEKVIITPTYEVKFMITITLHVH